MATRAANREAEVESASVLLTSLPRPGYRGGSDSELRVSLDTFNGHQYLSIRIWDLGRDGVWRPSPKRGVTVRFAEAGPVVAALLDGLERSGWSPSAGRAGPLPPRPIRRPDEAPPATFTRRRAGPEQPILLPSDDELDEAERRRTPPWKGPDPDRKGL